MNGFIYEEWENGIRSERQQLPTRSRNASNYFQGPRNVTSTKTISESSLGNSRSKPDHYSSRPYDPTQDPTTPHQNSATRTSCKGNRYSSHKDRSWTSDVSTISPHNTDSQLSQLELQLGGVPRWLHSLQVQLICDCPQKPLQADRDECGWRATQSLKL